MEKLTPQQNKVLEWLKNGWYCTSGMNYMTDYRKRISELKRKGYELQSRPCQNLNHNHGGGNKEWRWIQKQPIGYRVFKVEGKEVMRVPVYQ